MFGKRRPARGAAGLAPARFGGARLTAATALLYQCGSASVPIV